MVEGLAQIGDDRLSTEAAGERFGEMVEHAARDKARVVLTRNGEPIAALVPIEDVEALEAIEDAEDARLAEEAIAAWEAAGRPLGISHAEMLERYGITPDDAS